MTRAIRSRPAGRRAARARIVLACLVLATVSGPARADEARTFVVAPIECLPYYQLRGDSVEGWNRWLSFAACAQDATVAVVDDVDQLPALVEDLQASLVPTLELYLAAVKRGPDPVKMRAAFQMAMTQVALMTRARSSIKVSSLWTDPGAAAHFEQLHAELEPLLEQPAFLAWTLLDAIDRIVAEKPSLAPDPVTRNMARMAHDVATQLGESWSFPRKPELPPRLADPR